MKKEASCEGDGMIVAGWQVELGQKVHKHVVCMGMCVSALVMGR